MIEAMIEAMLDAHQPMLDAHQHRMLDAHQHRLTSALLQ
jgi:hypothetical protein